MARWESWWKLTASCEHKVNVKNSIDLSLFFSIEIRRLGVHRAAGNLISTTFNSPEGSPTKMMPGVMRWERKRRAIPLLLFFFPAPPPTIHLLTLRVKKLRMPPTRLHPLLKVPHSVSAFRAFRRLEEVTQPVKAS